MELSERAAQLHTEYLKLAHAVQSGVAYQMEKDPNGAATTPKHLRVGVNMAMVEHSALALLLMKKGIITDVEYYEMLIVQATAEKEKYELVLSQMYGGSIKLA